LRVTTEASDDCNEIDAVYSVDCPQRGRLAIDACVACPQSGRIRYHHRGRGLMVIECTYIDSPNQRTLKLVRFE